MATVAAQPAPVPGNTSNPTMLSSQLLDLLAADDIVPGATPSYQICKVIYLYHPLGAKMVETPVKIAQSEPRTVSVKGAPDEVVKAFNDTHEELQIDYYIRGLMYSARTYGNGTLVCGIVGAESNKEPLDLAKLATATIYFSYFDALNTAGSLLLDQDPNSPTFMKHGDITVGGVTYHRSRACVMYNEMPIYLSYTSSGFGFNGRSVYQRVLYPLKSFIQTMITDDMVTYKAGLIIAKIKAAGSIISAIMQAAAGLKRALLQLAGVGNVISVGTEDSVESIDLQNIDKAMITARNNVLENIASGSDMPAQILKQESFAEGFGEGTEDMKNVTRYIDGVRKEMAKPYKFTDRIVQHRAWNEEFFATMQDKYPEQFKGKQYKQVFQEWQNNFSAIWPNLLREPDSELSKAQKVQVEALVQIYESLGKELDPKNKAAFVQWVVDNINSLEKIFPVGVDIDPEDLEKWIAERQEKEDELALAQNEKGVGGNKSDE